MLEVQICVGSSCHVKGAYQVVQTFQEMVKTHQLEANLHLKACFCQKNCTQGVTIKVGDKLISKVSPENAREIFHKEIFKEGDA